MAAKIDQKAYLQKYLSGKSRDKKKKKKKSYKGKGLVIVDDDLDISKLQTLDGEDLDIFDQGEDAPQIAGIIDERPEEVKKREQYNNTTKWRVINEFDGINSKLQIQEIKKDVKEKKKETELIFGKMYSDSEDEKKNDSDASPPRKHENKAKQNNTQTKKIQNNSDSDFSPPRKTNNVNDTTRNVTQKSVSPEKLRNKKNYDSDVSPPRRTNCRKEEKRRKEEHRRSRSLERKSANSRHKQETPTRKDKRKKRSRWGDADTTTTKNTDSDASPSRKNSKHRHSPDSDLSPPRKSHPSTSRSTTKKRSGSNSDASPPRRRKNSSDSDMSPPRKFTKQNPIRSKDFNRDSPPPSNKKMAKTLEGKVAGLQNAVQLRSENEELRRREDEIFSRMREDVSGKNAQVVSRKKKRETSAERQKQQEKNERQKMLDEMYKRWNKGIKQVEDQERRVDEFMHESSKPLARHVGDEDLERSLRGVQREGDPMLGYIREKKRERGELPPEKPSYKGSCPPNRFNIRPGYRWDGVDRSNGYEKKYFENQSKKRAQDEDYYKWSSADL